MSGFFPVPDDDEPLTRRQWLTRRVVSNGVRIWDAIDAVASTALEHPEWDMDEERTYGEWREEG